MALSFAGLAYGQDEGYRKVWVTLSDGSSIEVELSETLETSFIEDQVVFADGNTQYSFPKNMVKSFKFDSQPLSISQTAYAEARPIINNGVIEFNLLPENSRVVLLGANGKIYFDTVATGHCTLALPELSKGVYVVNVNSMSYKVIIK